MSLMNIPRLLLAQRLVLCLPGVASLELVISGRKGLTRSPHHQVDPVLAASSAVISLQGIVSRCRLSVTSFNGGSNLDMIPDTVVIGGTFNAFSNASFYNLLQRIEEVIVVQASAFRCSVTVDCFEKESTIYHSTVNDDRMFMHVKKVATDLLGPPNFRVVPPMMGAEDFYFYSEVVPAAFYYIGVRSVTLGVYTYRSLTIFYDR
ncbi:hypothetical protein REPUB_Repub02eG0102700 [Reevesia pubescens]